MGTDVGSGGRIEIIRESTILKRLFAASALLALLVTPAFGEVIFSDTFAGRDGSLPGAWQRAGANGAGQLQSNQLSIKDAGPQPAYVALARAETAQWSNYFVSVDFWSPSTGAGAVVAVRRADAQNFYEGGVFSEGGKLFLKIDKVVAGQRETLARKDKGPDADIPPIDKMSGYESRHVMRMVATGDSVVVQASAQGGVAVSLEAKDSSLAKGGIALGAVNGTVNFDNVIVKDEKDIDSLFSGGKTTVYASAGGGTSPRAPGLLVAAAGPGAPGLSAVNPPAPGLSAATAASAGGSGKYRVRVASNLPDAQAEQFASALKNDAYSPVQIVERAGGKVLLVGAVNSEEAARALMSDLGGKGYSPEGVETEGEAPPVVAVPMDSLGAAGGGTGSTFRVLVGEFNDRSKTENEAAAQKLKSSLLQDDYVNVDLESAGDGYQVLMGSFTTEADAQKLSDSLRREGYSQARTAAKAGGTVSGFGLALTAPTLTPEQMRNLSPDQQAELLALLNDLKAAQEGKALSFEEWNRLTTRKKELEGKLGIEAAKATESQQELADRQKKMFNLNREFNKAMLDEDWDTAEAKLEDMRALSPDDSMIRARAERLDRRKALAKGPDGKTGGATPIATLREQAKAAFDRQDYQGALVLYSQVVAQNPSDSESISRIAEINRRTGAGPKPLTAPVAPVAGPSSSAPNYLLYGGIVILVVLGVVAWLLFQNMRREKQLIEEVKELAATTAAQTPSGGVRSLNFPEISTTPKTAPSPARGSSALAGGSALSGGSALAGSSSLAGMGALAGGADLFTEPPPAAREVTGTEPTQVATPVPPPPPAVPVPSSPAPIIIEERPHGEPDVLVLSGLHETPSVPPPSVAPPAPSGVAESIDLSGLNFPMGGTDEPMAGLGGLNLPDLPPLGDLPTVTAASGIGDLPAFTPGPLELPPLPMEVSEPGPPAAPAISGSISLPEDLVPMSPPVEPPPPVAPPPPVISVVPEAIAETTKIPAAGALAAAASAAGAGELLPPAPIPPPSEPVPAPESPGEPGVFFAQDFSSQDPGENGAGWQGDYDYATLKVSDDAPPAGSARYLRFEKRAGAGSANYVCRFPKASGRVNVEFDIRCDDKNKYLLGFYIEKDEDFKQSVHTIIHRTDSKTQPTIRIQGEPVPYDLGKWVHVKYELNLLAGMVTAFVDGQQVVRDAKLPTNPPFVNTLSIRDNLATTGVLGLANIRIIKG